MVPTLDERVLRLFCVSRTDACSQSGSIGFLGGLGRVFHAILKPSLRRRVSFGSYFFPSSRHGRRVLSRSRLRRVCLLSPGARLFCAAVWCDFRCAVDRSAPGCLVLSLLALYMPRSTEILEKILKKIKKIFGHKKRTARRGRLWLWWSLDGEILLHDCLAYCFNRSGAALAASSET